MQSYRQTAHGKFVEPYGGIVQLTAALRFEKRKQAKHDLVRKIEKATCWVSRIPTSDPFFLLSHPNHQLLLRSPSASPTTSEAPSTLASNP